MTLDPRSLALDVFAVAVVAACLVSACYPEPEAPACFTETQLESGSVPCPSLEAHEHIAGMSFLLNTKASSPDNLRGWTVVVRADGWSEKYGRAYFTDSSAPGWVLWGLTDLDARTIYLADDNLARAVLAHEECHVHFPPPFTHADWPRLGCDLVEQDVTERLTIASGLYDGSTSDGIYDPEEAYAVPR